MGCWEIALFGLLLFALFPKRFLRFLATLRRWLAGPVARRRPKRG